MSKEQFMDPRVEGSLLTPAQQEALLDLSDEHIR